MLLILLLLSASDANARAEEPAIRVLVVTGGHDFDPRFYHLFEDHEDIAYRRVAHPNAFPEFAPGRADTYDVVVLYDMYHGTPIAEQAREHFLSLLKSGKGLVVLHHALASYPSWPEYRKIIGGKYLLAAEKTASGETVPGSTYRHDVRFRVRIADPSHPITAGLKDFYVFDETYNRFAVEPGVQELLRADHPTSGPVIGWAKQYLKARVVYLQPGHGAETYRHPSYRRLVARSIRWVAGRPDGALDGSAGGAVEGKGDPAWQAAADARIEKHRKGPILVRVVDGGGRPVEGAAVTFRQQRHEFLFGCNIFLHGRLQPPADEETYRSRFAALFNYATLPFYWRRYEPRQGQPAHEDRERIAGWCREHRIATKGHPLVWNHPASVPVWLSGESGEIRSLSEARVEDCVGRFKGLIDIWDVVNEATDPGRFRDNNPMTDAMQELGVVDWTVRSFLAARRSHPKAQLLINDYRTDEAYERLIARLVHDGNPVYDTIGIQSHMHGGVWAPGRVWRVCETFARFGVPLHFTETTIVSGSRQGRRWGPSEPEREETQAAKVAMFYTMLFSHPAVEAITWWDFADRGAWQGAPAGFLRRDLTPKPAYDRLLDLVRRRWWTDEKATTDRKGEARVRGFFGAYEIQVEKGDRRKVLQRQHSRKAGRLEAKVAL
jgi:GH35 family endo-1,4-beta-xylanase/type 1 glutamine amidotransferase